MKRELTATILLFALLQSCGSEKSGLQLINSKLNMDHIFTPLGVDVRDYDFVTRAFDQQNFIYRDSSKNKILDTLDMGHEMRVQTSFGISAYGTTLPFYNVIYLKNGRVNKGIIFDENISYAYVASSKNPSVCYIGKYVKTKMNEASLVIKAIDSSVLIDEVELDTHLSPYYDLLMGASVTTQLKNEGEILYCQYSYPACGHDSKWYYLNFNGEQFISLCNGESELEEKTYTSIYFPQKINNTYLLAQMYDHNYWPDKKPISIPQEFSDYSDKLILVETHSHEGNEYEIKNDRVVERKWLKWDGEKIEELRNEIL